jgi:hypothetical protein
MTVELKGFPFDLGAIRWQILREFHYSYFSGSKKKAGMNDHTSYVQRYWR